MEELKKCSKCGEILPHSAFSKNATKNDGLQTYCKLCSKEITYSWRSSNPDKTRLLDINKNTKQRKNLTKAIIANQLRIHVKELPKELYQMKKSAILLGRELKATNTSAAI